MAGLDLDAVASELKTLLPSDDAAREALATRPDVFCFLKDTLASLNAVDLDSTESSKQLGLAITLANLIAEISKSELARQSFADMDGIPLLVSLYMKSIGHLNHSPAVHPLDDLTIQTMRALANLCFDHEANRDIIGDLPGAAASLVLTLSSTNTLVLQTASGALVNISMDNEPVQVSMLGAKAISLLLAILQKADVAICNDEPLENAISSAIRALSNLLEPESGVAQLLQQNGIVFVIHLVKKMHSVIVKSNVTAVEYDRAMNLLDGLAIVLETIGEKDNVQREIVSKALLGILLDFVEQKPTFKHAAEDDEASEDISYAHIRKTMARVVTTVTMNDDNMKELVTQDQTIARLQSWMAFGLNSSFHKDEEDIRMSAALCIGNLARSDASCLKLVEHHRSGAALVTLIKLEIDHLRSVGGVRGEAKSSIKVLHAAIGALKNMSLAVRVRPTLGSINTIECIVSLFDFEYLKPVQYSCVGVLKNLTAGTNDLNVYRLLTGLVPGDMTNLSEFAAPSSNPMSPLGRLIALIWKATDDNDTGIRNEGGRVITNIVRAIHRSKATQFLNILFDLNCITPLVQIVTGAMLTKPIQPSETGDAEFVGDHHVHFDALPIEGQVFPLVQNEGLVALTLICSLYPAATSKIVRFYASLTPTLFHILKSDVPCLNVSSSSLDESVLQSTDRLSALGDQPTYSLQTKINVCLLLRTLLATEAEFLARISPDLKVIVTALMEMEIPEADPAAATSSSRTESMLQATALRDPAPPPTGMDMDVVASDTMDTSSDRSTAGGVHNSDCLSRTGTVSAKALASDGVPTRRELVLQYAAPEVLADPAVSFREVLRQLMSFMP
ncbi:hypothetical protein BSLG_000565 [Batrachochytrium salamandrivorans]|nr:hypothetical protein BSLG_000565 [Batrachochytrium salamandrivorans]